MAPRSDPLPSDLRADVERVGRLRSVPDVLRIVARLTGMRVAAVARVTDARWITGQIHDSLGFGLRPGDELVLESTLCNEIRGHGRPIAFGEASSHPVFAHHPTPRRYRFESYISVPIWQEDGSLFGTLCALDPEPRAMNPVLVEKVELLAQLVGAQLQSEARAEDSERRSRRSRTELGRLGASARLREELIGILGHELRNPLHSLRTVVDLLSIDELAQRHGATIRAMYRSLRRMEELIDFAHDFAHGNEPDPPVLDCSHGEELAEALAQVLDETRAAYPDRMLSSRLEIAEPVHGDAVRLAQLFGSLMINAVVHGRPDARFSASAASGGGRFRIDVHAPGGIEATRLAMLEASLHGSAEARARPDLGLQMAAEIARAHHGELQVRSGTGGTHFLLELPCEGPRPTFGRADATATA